MADRITPGICPVCGARLEVTRLHCHQCDTTIEGHFSLCKFCYLTPEQREFADTFIRCRGNIKEVERELGVSYPTVRSKLDSVIQAMGYKVEPERDAPADPAKRKIIESLNKGEITAEEALKLLKQG